MIVDFAGTDAAANLDADLCLVGAGAVGIATALEFVGTRLRIVVLESGGDRPEPDTQRLYDAVLHGLRCATVHDGRVRTLGGTTTLWAGQALRLDHDEFAARDWVQNSGWPLSLDELEPYYRRAERLLGVPSVAGDERDWPAGLPMPPSHDGLRRRFSTFAPSPNFETSRRAQLAAAANVTVLLHANATRLVLRDDGASVNAVEIASLDGRRGHVRARSYVICCGGVETPRLLLASRGPRTRGVGNERDLVGRFFQEHAHVNLPISGADRRALARMFHGRRIAGVRHFAKLTAAPELQRAEQLVSVGADICYDPRANVAVQAIKQLRSGPHAGSRLHAAALVAAHPRQLGSAGYRRLVLGHKASEGSGLPYFCVQAETVPRRESRVLLDGRVDALGMPRAIVDWRVAEPELRTIEQFARRLDSLLAANALGRLAQSPLPLPRDLELLSEVVAGGCHHIGTARMATTPQDGVVDTDCRVFGIENLSIAGSAVFPTGGWSNPTLTLLALGYRLADRLKAELAARPEVRPPRGRAAAITVP